MFSEFILVREIVEDILRYAPLEYFREDNERILKK